MAPSPSKRDSASKPSAAQLRRELRKLDRQLALSCQQRAKLRRQLFQLTGDAEDAPVTGAIAQLVSTCKGPLPSDALATLFREVDSSCRALLRRTRISYLGPEYSYSHLAAIERFGLTSDLVPVASISAVFESVNRGDVQFGIVPIENSTDGRIVDTLEMFVRLPVKICGEVPMRIHHYLLGKGTLAQVREIHSKPQALSQCRNWLAMNLPRAKLVPTASTTAAAEMAATDPSVAAVASRQAGSQYKLETLVERIEDNPDNITRFAVISTESARRTGSDKTSVMFELAHVPGALADAMAVFKRNRLNLTWIESFPKKGSQNEYLFFAEMEGHASDASVRRALRSLDKKTVQIEILGSYARCEPVGG